MEVRVLHIHMSDEYIENNGVKVSVRDMKKYWREHADPGFSEARNKATVKRVIEHNEKMFKKMREGLDEATRERAHAVAYFFDYKKRGGGKDVVGYLGNRELARLRGDELVEKLKRVYAPQKQQ